jgi:acetoin:2,6-dichlorophenolindophenol oxidoreductase subunit alpha
MKHLREQTMQPTATQQLWMYGTMVKSRYYEARIAEAYLEGKRPVFNMAKGPLPGEMHLSDGQEPPAVGLAAHLEPRDYVTCHHRGHAHAIAKGVNLERMTAEIFGKRSGFAGGRGGHMHIFDPDVNFAIGGIIAQGMGPAAGAALANMLRKQDGVAIAIIGEGGANQGAFHEVLNLAALWKLPFVCVIEDNKWAVSVPKHKSTAVPRNDVRAAAYGIPGEYVAGNDPEAIFDACGRAIARARSGLGPSLIEIETIRLAGHFMGDPEAYRPGAELESKGANDPIPRYRASLIASGTLTAADDEAIVRRARADVDAAIAFARDAAEPAPADALEAVFV